MTAAIFALAGTLLGICGALVVELRRGRYENARSRREALRLACADFTDAIIRERELTVRLIEAPSDAQLRESVRLAHSEAWVHYERLRFISTSQDVQKAGRYVLRYSWGFILQADGHPPRDDEKNEGPFALSLNWLHDFYVAVRRELGLPRAENVYREPDEWLTSFYRPVKPSQQEHPPSIEDR